MIVTAVPQTAALAYASEQNDSSEGNVSEGSQNSDENGAGDEKDPNGNGTEEPGTPDDTDVADDPDGTDSDNAEEITGTAQPVSEPDNGVSDNDVPGDSISDNDVPDESVSDNDVGGEEQKEPATVRILIPTYPYTSASLKSYIKEVQYKIGESEEWTTWRVKSTVKPGRDDHMDISLEAGAALQFKVVPVDRAVMNGVNLNYQDALSNPGSITECNISLEAENDIYRIDSTQLQFKSPVYNVNISADFLYTFHFADVYADAHEGQRSVKLYQYTTGSADKGTGEDTGDSGVTEKDVIGETVELAGAEMERFFADHYYKVEAESGYTFHSLDTNTTGIRIYRDSSGCYGMEGGYNLGVQDITVFVLAEPTETHQLKFNIPTALKDKLVLSVMGTDPAGNSTELELINGAATVKNDMTVTVDAWLEDDLEHTLRATCTAAGGDAEELFYDSREKMNNLEGMPYAWRNTYRLGDMLRDGDVTIDFAQINMYPVTLHAEGCGSQIRAIYIEKPAYKSYWYENGDYENLTVDVAEGEKLKFCINDGWLEGTLHVSTAEDGSGEIPLKYDEELEQSVYTASPAGPMDIYFKVTGYEYRFDYSESDFSVLVYDADNTEADAEPLELSDGHVYTGSNSRMHFRIMVKPNNDKWGHTAVSYVPYWDELELREAVRASEHDDTENGYLCYVTEEYTHGNSSIRIEGYNTHKVTLAKNDKSVYFQRGFRQDWDEGYIEWIDIEETYDQLSTGITVREGEEVYFRVRGYNSDTHNLRVDFTSAGSDTLGVDQFEDGEVYYYYFTPTADATVTAEVTERKQHTVTVEKGDSITGLEVRGGTKDEGGSGSADRYLVRDGDSIIIRKVSNDGAGGLLPGYRSKVLCTADGKTYEAQMEYVYGGRDDNDEIIWIQTFEIAVTGDMTLHVDAVQSSVCTVTFADPDKLAQVRVWELGKSAEQDNLYDAQTHSAALADDKEYYFDFKLTDGSAPESIVMKGAAGDERQLWLGEDEITTYLLGVPQGDAQITVNTVPGYTILFAAEKDSGLEYYEDVTGYGNEITNEKIQVAATKGFPFSWSGTEDEYELSLDSDAFTIKKTWVTNGYDEDGWYQYSVEPVRTGQLPTNVTVSAKEYPAHTITMDYTAQIKNIYLENTAGDRLWNRGGDREVQVQGTGTILGVRTISGYSPEVKMQATTGGEARVLTPFRVNDSGVSEYHIGELTEDVTLSVGAVRSTQKQIYYEVGFLSIGNKVRIADAVAQTPYSVAGSNDDYWNYIDKYSVLKGSSIAFTVEAADGYEVDGVYANDEAVTPVQGVYTVTPVKDTQIRADVNRIERKYPVTFVYPDTVAGVKVKDFTLQDNMLQAKAGTQISFTVELADQNHSVTSVKMNGKELSFDQANGCYTMITIAEAMKVEITTAEADKRVTFTKTVEHMDYSVETGEMVKESETAGTYIVAAAAGILRFTVTSSRKESVPAVTYISATEGKVTLQAKSKQETAAGVAYAYEITVAELPLKSEVEIGETNVAGEEDKTRLEEKINSYQGYVQKDYTPESWEVFAQALADAQACLEKADATSAEIDAVIAALEKAAAGLKKAEENPPTPVIREGLWIEEIPDQMYTGSAFKPEVKVYNGEELLIDKKDYTVSYKNNTNAGTATVTVKGKGNYKANDTATFNILKKDLSDADIIVSDVYTVIKANGKVANPKVTVQYGKKKLKSGTDYTVEYPVIPTGTDGKAIPGTYEIKIHAKKNNDMPALNYTGSRTVSYEVCSSDTLLMSKAKITLSATKVTYAGDQTEIPKVTEVKIGSTVLTEADYEVSALPDHWNQCGKASITVTGKAGTKYYGSKSVTYSVEGTELTAKNLEITGIRPEGYAYTGKPIYVSRNEQDGSKGDMIVRIKDSAKELTEGTDYIVSYKTGKMEGEHTSVGNVTVTITGINAYTGSVKKTFKITPFELENYNKDGASAGLRFDTAAEAKVKYTKIGAKPVFTLTFNNGEDVRALVEKTDYTVSYSGNTKVKPGEQSAVMTIKGKGNFKGKIVYQYEVTGASVSDTEATATDIVMPSQFSKLKTTVKVVERSTGKVLKAGTDYEKAVKYYSDEACTTEITADNFGSLQMNDTVYARVIMKGNYAGSGTEPGQLVAPFRLYEDSRNIADARKYTIRIETGKTAAGEGIACDTKGNPIYTSKEIKPKVIITLKNSDVALTEGVDYEVDYSNNINKGKAAVTVTGIGQYGGTKSIKFAIVSADMTLVKQAQKAAEKALETIMEMLAIPE